MNLFDKYFLVARVFPILIFVTPFIAVTYFVFGFSLDYNLALGSIPIIAVMYFISQNNKEWGKKMEEKLFTKWGGKPTNILLRESDNTIIDIEKSNIKVKLAQMTGYAAPTIKFEKEHIVKADDTYELYCKYLRNATRDKLQFPVVFDELSNYGFIRNLISLKKLAIILLIIILTALIIYAYLSNWKPNRGVYISIGIVIMFIFIWIAVSEKWLKKVAFRYARILLDSATHIKS